MTVILGWLFYLAQLLSFWSKEIFKEIVKWSVSFWGLVVIVAGIAYTVFNDIVGTIQSILSALTGMDYLHPSLVAPGVGAQLLMVANTFTPLDELFAYAAVYFVLMGLWSIYQAIKSYLPAGFAGGAK